MAQHLHAITIAVDPMEPDGMLIKSRSIWQKGEVTMLILHRACAGLMVALTSNICEVVGISVVFGNVVSAIVSLGCLWVRAGCHVQTCAGTFLCWHLAWFCAQAMAAHGGYERGEKFCYHAAGKLLDRGATALPCAAAALLPDIHH